MRWSRALAHWLVAALLAGLGLVTLVLKSLLEWRFAGQLAGRGH